MNKQPVYRHNIFPDDNWEGNDQWGSKEEAVTEQCSVKQQTTKQHKAKHTKPLPITKRNPGKEQKAQAVSGDQRLLIIP